MKGPAPSGLEVEITVPGRLDVAFGCDAGSVLAVIGPNGAGKSTLVGVVAGLVPGAGRVRLDGVDLQALAVRERRTGLVFQDRRLFPHLSARDNVAFGLRARGVRRQRAARVAEEWLGRVGLGDLADRRPDQLSGGQAQRVAIARALATDPDVLLLDEPMAGLDVGVAAGLRTELGRHLADFEGVTVLVTHDAIDALTLADRVLVLEQGRLAQEGTLEEVTRHPSTEHVARLVGLNLVDSPPEADDPGTRLTFGPEDVIVATHRPDDSTRLRWQGTVGQVARHEAGVRIVVHTDTAGDLLADVTAAAAAELGLQRGSTVWLSVKETAVRRHRPR